jgi:quinol monooxygenase YgiN
MPVRVLVTVTAPSAEAAEEALAERVELCKRTEAEEEGCLQYEVFQSRLHPNRYVLCELWTSKRIYDIHWNLQTERNKNAPPKPTPPPPKPGQPARGASVEMYIQNVYKNVDGTWMAADPDDRGETIRWIG